MPTPTVSISSGMMGAASFDASRLESILSAASLLAKQTAGVVEIVASDGTIYCDTPTLVELPAGTGFRFRGAGRGTRIQFRGTAGLAVNAPDLAGYPTLRSITTNVLGCYVKTEEGEALSEITLEKLCFAGLSSTPSTANRHWTGLCLLSSNVKLKDLWIEHAVSASANLTQKATYASYSSRSVSSFTPIMVGQDRWEEPDPIMARTCSNVTIQNIVNEGERLGETGETTKRANGIHLRKCVNVKIEGVQYSNLISPTEKMVNDVLISSVPSHNDTLLVNDWNPYTKQQTQVTYTWKKKLIVTLSGVPSDADYVEVTNAKTGAIRRFVFKSGGGTAGAGYEYIDTVSANTTTIAGLFVTAANAYFGSGTFVASTNVPYSDKSYITATKSGSNIALTQASSTALLRGESVGEAATNLAAVVNANNVKVGGSYFSEAKDPLSYLSSSTTGACRIQQALVTSGPYSSVGATPFFDDGSGSNKTAYCVIGTGSYGSVRVVNQGKRRTTYSKYGIWMEDCFGKGITNLFVGANKAEAQVYGLSTVEHNAFGVYEWSEGGHDFYDNIIGDGAGYTEAMLDLAGAAFTELGSNVIPGQCGGDAPVVLPAATVRVKAGNHREWLADLTSTNAANGDVLYIDDGNSNTASFTFKTAPDTLKIALGAVPGDGDAITIKWKQQTHTIRFKKATTTGVDLLNTINTTTNNTAALCCAAIKANINTLTGNSSLFAYTASNAYTNSGDLLVSATSSSSAITITTAPKEIKIGADTLTTLRAFRAAVQRQRDLRALQCFVSDGDDQGSGTYRVKITFFTETGKYTSWPRMRFTTGGANFTLTKHHQPYRPSYVTSHIEPHYVGDISSGMSATLWVEDAYGFVKVKQKINHTLPMNPGAMAQELVLLTPTGNQPANGDKLTITPSVGGTAQVFQFVNSITSDTVPTKYEVLIGATYVDTLYNLRDKINSITAAGAYASIAGAVFTILKAYPEPDSSFAVATINVGVAYALSRIAQRGFFTLSGVPADACEARVTQTAGALKKFTFSSTGGTDADPVYYINTGSLTTAEQCAEALANKINEVLGTVGSQDVATWNKGAMVYVLDSALAITLAESGDTGSLLTETDRVPLRLQGRHNPLVFINCSDVEVDNLSGTPIAGHDYSDTTGAFAASYGGVGTLENGFNGCAAQAAYVEQNLTGTITLGGTLNSGDNDAQVNIVLEDGSIGKFIFKTTAVTETANKWWIDTTTYSTPTTAAQELARKINYAFGSVYASASSGVVTLHGLRSGSTVTNANDPGSLLTVSSLSVANTDWKMVVRGSWLKGKTDPAYGVTHTPVLTAPWGPGRTGNAKFYDVGSELGSGKPATVSNIVLPSNSNYVNGAVI